MNSANKELNWIPPKNRPVAISYTNDDEEDLGFRFRDVANYDNWL